MSVIGLSSNKQNRYPMPILFVRKIKKQPRTVNYSGLFIEGNDSLGHTYNAIKAISGFIT